MTAITITLSDDDLAAAKGEAVRNGFAGVEEYLKELVTQRLHEDSHPTDGSTAPSAAFNERLTQLALEGLATPAREMTHGDFASMRRDLAVRYRPREK